MKLDFISLLTFCLKAIQLEQAIQKDNLQEFTQSLASFYQLKYGTPCPNLSRIDSTVRRATISCKSATQTRAKTLTATCSLGSGLTARTVSQFPTDDTTVHNTPNKSESEADEDGIYYLEMIDSTQPVAANMASNDDDNDDNGYTFMFQGKDTNVKSALENSIGRGNSNSHNGNDIYEDILVVKSGRLKLKMHYLHGHMNDLFGCMDIVLLLAIVLWIILVTSL